MRENAAAKARRYLAEGRLSITEVAGPRVRATARGDGVMYECGHSGGDPWGGWWCTCPARSACSHLLALRSVVAVAATDGVLMEMEQTTTKRAGKAMGLEIERAGRLMLSLTAPAYAQVGSPVLARGHTLVTAYVEQSETKRGEG